MRRLDPDRALKDVGRRIAELRRVRGWTQEEFAEELRLSTNNLQRIELGMQNLTIRSLVRLANALKVGLGELFVPPADRAVRPGRPRSE